MRKLLLQLRHAIEQKTSDVSFDSQLAISTHQGRESIHRTLTEPTLMVIINGEANVVIGSHFLTVKACDVLVLPPGELGGARYLGMDNQPFLWIGVHFSTEVVRHFKSTHGESLAGQEAPFRWHAPAPKPVVASILQWLVWNASYTSSLSHARHRQSELLLLLTEAGLAFNLLFDEQSRWSQRVHQLLSMDPKRRWYMKDVCRQLGVSEATLRRRLGIERTNFRQILEEVRLEAGLALLRKTKLQIGRISEDVGYISQSRFGERFKQHFGVTPSELRRLRTAPHGGG